jgi:hypothetical protein
VYNHRRISAKADTVLPEVEAGLDHDAEEEDHAEEDVHPEHERHLLLPRPVVLRSREKEKKNYNIYSLR